MAQPLPLFNALGMLQQQQELLDPVMLQGLPKQATAGNQQLPPDVGMAAAMAQPAPTQAATQVPYQTAYDKQFDDAYNESMGLRKSELDMLRKKLEAKEAQKPTGIDALDLKPFAAFTDTLTGNRTAQNFGEPRAVQQNRADVEKLQAMVDRNSNALSDDQLGYLKMKAQEQMADRRMDAALKSQERAAEKALNGDEDRLRKEYLSHPSYKTMAELNQAYQALESNPGLTGPDQQALVYQFSKLLDPGSVVRESEYAMSRANAGAITQAEQYFELLRTGKGLNPDQLAHMKSVAKNLIESSRGILNQHNDLYKQLAVSKGVNPSRVVLDPFYKGKQASAAPAKSETNEALAWANANPNDPRSKAIKQRLGM